MRPEFSEGRTKKSPHCSGLEKDLAGLSAMGIHIHSCCTSSIGANGLAAAAGWYDV